VIVTQTLYLCIALVLYFLFSCMLVLFSRFGYNEINILVLSRTYIHTDSCSWTSTALPIEFFRLASGVCAWPFRITVNQESKLLVTIIRMTCCWNMAPVVCHIVHQNSGPTHRTRNDVQFLYRLRQHNSMLNSSIVLYSSIVLIMCIL